MYGDNCEALIELSAEPGLTQLRQMAGNRLSGAPDVGRETECVIAALGRLGGATLADRVRGAEAGCTRLERPVWCSSPSVCLRRVRQHISVKVPPCGQEACPGRARDHLFR